MEARDNKEGSINRDEVNRGITEGERKEWKEGKEERRE